MFGLFNFKRETKPVGHVKTVGPDTFITKMENGRFRLLTNGNEVVATYARKRDAERGAERRGLTVAEQAVGA